MAGIDELAEVIHGGLHPDTNELGVRTKTALAAIFGERYRLNSQYATRIALMGGDQNIPFAGLLHPENPNERRLRRNVAHLVSGGPGRERTSEFTDHLCLWYQRPFTG